MIEFRIVHGRCRAISCDSIDTTKVSSISIYELSQSPCIQSHIIRGLASSHTSRLISDGKCLTPLPGKAFLTEAVYYIKNSYDIFERPSCSLGESYITLEVMSEKKNMYGRYHNFYPNSTSQNGHLNLISQDRFDVEEISDASQKVFFPIIWHDDHRNYWHWHFEVLPRLLILRDLISQKVFSKHELSYIVIGDALSSYQLATASLVLGRSLTYRLMPRGARVPSSLIIHPVTPSTFSPVVLSELRKALQMFSSEPHGEQVNLFLDRSGGKNGRKICNNKEILQVLSDHAYRNMIDPGQCNYYSQQQIFSSAGKIVIPHGAALANLLYASKGINVLELCSDSYIHPEPAIFALLMGQRYVFLYGELAPDGWQRGDYYIDPNSLSTLLRDKMNSCT